MLRNRLWAAVVLVTLEERCALLPLRQEACFRNWFESGRAEPGLLRGGDALVFGLVQSGDDVRGAARLVAASFPSVTVGRSDVAWEDAALQTLSRLAAQWDVVEYSFAMQSRCGNRLRDARLATRDNTESLVFAVTTRDDDEVIACVELRLKDADGSAPPAFPRFQEWNEQPLPYISNVCVAPQFRRRGVAAALLDVRHCLVDCVPSRLGSAACGRPPTRTVAGRRVHFSRGLGLRRRLPPCRQRQRQRPKALRSIEVRRGTRPLRGAACVLRQAPRGRARPRRDGDRGGPVQGARPVALAERRRAPAAAAPPRARRRVARGRSARDPRKSTRHKVTALAVISY
ncbi:hypothetical protein M885DRAFT_506972 [Pelagophyceae sp. CCMP2097]|nr:hypothetical protein M885DRAFT_506972 [Pelagophyceae sp. CCMP2097]